MAESRTGLANPMLGTSWIFAVLSYKWDHFWDMPRRMLIFAFLIMLYFVLEREIQNYLSPFFIHAHTYIDTVSGFSC